MLEESKLTEYFKIIALLYDVRLIIRKARYSLLSGEANKEDIYQKVCLLAKNFGICLASISFDQTQFTLCETLLNEIGADEELKKSLQYMRYDTTPIQHWVAEYIINQHSDLNYEDDLGDVFKYCNKPQTFLFGVSISRLKHHIEANPGSKIIIASAASSGVIEGAMICGYLNRIGIRCEIMPVFIDPDNISNYYIGKIKVNENDIIIPHDDPVEGTGTTIKNLRYSINYRFPGRSYSEVIEVSK